ncbi:MAG: DUF4430 domain-containing protein [bacterium]
MPTYVSRALRALSVAALAAALIPSGASAADDVVAELRVLTPDSQLEPGASYVTNTEKVKTDRKAKCFIAGEGGSGDKVKLPGPTAMGLLATAGAVNPDVDPLSATDEFGFGLGLCGIGAARATTDDYWSLTVNHQAAQVGGDQLTLEDGDTVLWSLTQFPPPNELELRAGPGAPPGTLEVTVVEWVCSTDFPPPDPVCAESPAEGATVLGGDSNVTTGADGVASVPLSNEQTYELQAQLTGRLDSNTAPVCVSNEAAACPDPTDPVGRTIRGRRVRDSFAGTGGWDAIRSRGGKDVIDLTDGGSDRVNCGGAKDKVLLYTEDNDDEIAPNCEKRKRIAH